MCWFSFLGLHFSELDLKFTASGNDWGFAEMLSFDRLNSPDEGFLVNDTIIVEVDIPVCD